MLAVTSNSIWAESSFVPGILIASFLRLTPEELDSLRELIEGPIELMLEFKGRYSTLFN